MNAPLNIDITQILLHVLNLVILVGGLSLLLYKPVSRFLRERRAHYEALEQENAEKAEACEKLKAEYEEKLRGADALLQERRLAAEQEMAETANRYVEDARAKAEAILREAEEDAEARKTHILESAQTELGELVLSAAQKLLADTATPEQDAALYDEFIRMTGSAAPKKDDDHA